MGGFVSIYFSFCFLLCFVYLFYFKCLSLLKKILLQYYYFFISSFIASFIFNLTQLLQNLMVHNLMLTYNPKLVIPQMLLAYMKSSDLNLLKSVNLGGFIFVYFSFCFLFCFMYLSYFKCLSLLKEILLQYYCLYFLIHNIFHFYSYTASSKSNGSQSHANLQPQDSYSTNATCTCEKFCPHQQLWSCFRIEFQSWIGF